MNILNELLPGDYVTGKGHDNWKRYGKVSEMPYIASESFIYVEWDDGITERASKKSLKKCDPPLVVQPPIQHVAPPIPPNQIPPAAAVDSDGDNMEEGEPVRESGSEMSESEPSDDDDDSGGDSDENDNIAGQNPAVIAPVVAAIVNAGPVGGRGGGMGAGRGGRGRGGRGPYVPPQPPSPLHACIDKGNWNTPPTYKVWLEEETNLDPSNGRDKHERPMQLKWNGAGVFGAGLDVPPVEERSLMHYYLLMFPMQYLSVILECTNRQLLAHNPSNKPLTKHEFFTYKAIRIATALRPIDGPIREYWDKVESEDDIFPAFDFEARFKMTHHRFKILTNCLRLAEYTPLTVSLDPYLPIEGFIEAFNARRRTVVNPGRNIVVDECMSSWKGEEMVLAHESVMHVTKIQRKPKGVGVEFKSCADGGSHVLLQLEIQKSKLANQNKRFAAEYPFHVAVVLRLVAHWFGTGRRIIADAAFSSLATCTALLLNGLFYLGIVKTATKGYPVQFCKNWEGQNPVRGDHRSISTTVNVRGEARKVISSLWCSKRDQVKKLIGTCSTTLNGDAIRVQRSKRVLVEVDEEEKDDADNDDEGGDAPAPQGIWVTQRAIVPTDRPKIAQDLFEDFGAIDLHDRYRQGILKLEMVWRTRFMWQRLFATIEGMIVTDAYWHGFMT
jgi:hypothetical protein